VPQPANAERIIQIAVHRSAGVIADLTTELALTTEALERARTEAAQAQARVAELEGAAPFEPAPPKNPVTGTATDVAPAKAMRANRSVTT